MVQAAKSLLDELREGWTEAFNGQDPVAFGSFYLEDSQLLPPTTPLVSGREAIQGFWKSVKEMGMQDGTLTPVKVDVCGYLAYEVGTYSLNLQPPEAPRTVDAGKYLKTFERLQSGEWKIAADMFSSDSYPPAR